MTLALIAFVIYGNTLNYGYVLDDPIVTTENQYVQKGLKGIFDIFSNGYLNGFTSETSQSYRPLVLASFAIEHHFFGNDPTISHFFNVVLYAISAILVYLLAMELFPKYMVWLHFIVALLFLVHPIHTEVVANIKSRDEMLCFLFSLASIIWMLRYIRQKITNHLILSVLFLALALLSKETSITLVILLPLTTWFFTSNKPLEIGRLFIPHLFVFVAYLGLRIMVLGGSAPELDIHVINNALVASDGFIEKYATSLYILLLYMKLLIIPHPLSWDYSFNQIPIVGMGNWETWISIVTLLGLVYLVIKGFLKKDPLSYFILFFFITISMVSNFFVLIGVTLGERLLFTPSLSISFIVVGLLVKWSSINPMFGNAIKTNKFIIPVIIISIAASLKTINRNAVWKNDLTLFQSGVKTSPNSAKTWSALGGAYRSRAENASSQEEFSTHLNHAFSCYKKSLDILDLNFPAWYNLGVCYEISGNREASLSAYKKTLSINPMHQHAWNNIGFYYFELQNYDSASYYFEKTIALNPINTKAMSNLGATYFNQGKINEALFLLEKSFKINPKDKNTAQNLSLVFFKIGKEDEGTYYKNMVNRK